MDEYISQIKITQGDEENLIDLFGEEFFRNSVKAFCEKFYDQSMEKLNDAYQNKNCNLIRTGVHSFKGAAS